MCIYTHTHTHTYCFLLSRSIFQNRLSTILSLEFYGLVQLCERIISKSQCLQVQYLCTQDAKALPSRILLLILLSPIHHGQHENVSWKFWVHEKNSGLTEREETSTIGVENYKLVTAIQTSEKRDYVGVSIWLNHLQENCTQRWTLS